MRRVRSMKPSHVLMGLTVAHAVCSLTIIATDAFYLNPSKETSLLLPLYYSLYLPFRLGTYLLMTFLAIRFDNGFEVGFAAYAWSTLWTVTIFYDFAASEEACVIETWFCAIMVSLVGILQLLIYVFGFMTRGDVGWRFFYIVGCSVEIKELYNLWQMFQSLIKM